MTAFEDLIAPIPGDNPSGLELRYEPIYNEIKEARRDDGDLPPEFEGAQTKRADWARVAKLAEGGLAKQSKDLQLVAWLAEASLHRGGFGEFAETLRVARTLVEDFWDTVYPELDGDDADFRAAPLNWVGTALELVVQTVPINEAGHGYLQYRASRDVPTQEQVEADSDLVVRREEAALTPEDAEAGIQSTSKAWFKSLVAGLGESRVELKALSAACNEKFSAFEQNDQVPPRFSETGIALEAVQKLAVQLLEQKLEVDPDPVDLTAIPSSDGIMESSEPTSGPPTSRDDACARVAVAARYLREEDPTDPAPYLMVRGLRWGELRAGGNTLDPRLLLAPPTATRTHLKGMLLDGSWAQLLEAGEEVMATPFGRGWLDLQRYILTATDSLGGGYEAVGSAIRGALRALLRDMPDLAEATLMDDTPTGNRETRGWLRDESLFGEFTDSAEAEMEGSAPAPTSRDSDSVQRVVTRARSEAQAGRHEKAMKLVQARAAAEANPRNRFLLKTESAAIMVEGGHHMVALPILHQLYEDMATAQLLTQWEEPKVIARPMGLLYRCSLATGDTSVDADSLYLEVCKLDPMMAIELKQAAAAATGEGHYEEGEGG
ncbi:MAG: type VI secretion system protein ImpA [Myxococcota bacterium]|jgi:type VI secretion system protein ImpA